MYNLLNEALKNREPEIIISEQSDVTIIDYEEDEIHDENEYEDDYELDAYVLRENGLHTALGRYSENELSNMLISDNDFLQEELAEYLIEYEGFNETEAINYCDNNAIGDSDYLNLTVDEDGDLIISFC